MNADHYVIGCGGVGSWLVAALSKLFVADENLILVDGDTLEEKNLDRQLFSLEHIGMKKATALRQVHLADAECTEYYYNGLIAHAPTDWLFCCVDNHPGRLEVLNACDSYGCNAIFGGNEVHSSEAYVYRPSWKGTRLDPRTYYPEIATDQSDDPRAGLIGCTGHAQVAKPQLVTANYMAAALMAHLYVGWGMELPKHEGEEAEMRQHYPHQLYVNLTQIGSKKTGVLL